MGNVGRLCPRPNVNGQCGEEAKRRGGGVCGGVSNPIVVAGVDNVPNLLRGEIQRIFSHGQT